MRHAAVVGMGHASAAIGALFLKGGYRVTALDCVEGAGQGLAEAIRLELRQQSDMGSLPQGDLGPPTERLRVARCLKEVAGCDPVVEAGIEEPTSKASALAALDALCPPTALLSIMTCSLSVTALTSGLTHPDRAIGMHFARFSPTIKLVEVAPGHHTSEKALARALDLAKELNLEVVHSRDMPGFLLTRMLMVQMNEAAYGVYLGITSLEQRRRSSELTPFQAMDPLEQADFVGLDHCQRILRNLYETYGDPKYFPCPIFGHRVSASLLGLSTGEGFYRYDARSP